MGRSPCCVKEGLNKGAWTAMEDKILTDYITAHGEGRWRNLPKRAGLKRCGKSCRLRWLNYLRPDIKRGNITSDEEELIIRLHKLLGNRWSLIAGRLPGRTDNEIKNYWNTNLSKRLNQQQHHQAPSNNLVAAELIKKPQHDQKKKRARATNEPKPSTQPVESNVVRTKAVRCTKTFINPQPLPRNDQTIDNAIHTNILDPQPYSKDDPNGDISPNIYEINMPPSDMMMIDEFPNMGDDFNLNELLGSEFSDEIYLDPNNMVNLSPCSTMVFSQDQLFENWVGGDQQAVDFCV